MADNRLPQELELKLNALQCPFNWMKEFSNEDLYSEEFSVKNVAKKFKTSTKEDFLYYGFPVGMCLIYEYSVKKQATAERIKNVVDYCELTLNLVIDSSDKKKENSELITKAKASYQHVLQSCKTFFHVFCGDIQALHDILQDIQPYETFNNQEQACVNGIKAAFLLIYGPFKNTLVSIDCAKTAVELDGTEGWYYFLAGKGLFRYRRHYNKRDDPGREELHFMKKAKQLGFNNEEAAMFLIEMYSEMGSRKSNHLQGDLYNMIEDLCRYICETSTDWYCMWRCCRALLCFRKWYIHFDLLQQWLKKAERLSPKNPDILMTFAKTYSLQNNKFAALIYAKMAAEENGAACYVNAAILQQGELCLLLITLFSEIQVAATKSQLNIYKTKLDELTHVYALLKCIKPPESVICASNGFIPWWDFKKYELLQLLDKNVDEFKLPTPDCANRK